MCYGKIVTHTFHNVENKGCQMELQLPFEGMLSLVNV